MIDDIKQFVRNRLADNGLSRIQDTDDKTFGSSFLKPPSATFAVKIGNIEQATADGSEVRLEARVLLITVGRGQQECTDTFMAIYHDMITGFVEFTNSNYVMQGCFAPVEPQEPEVVASSRREYVLAIEFTATVIYTKL